MENCPFRFLDNACTVSVMSKTYYDQHEILYECKKIPSFNLHGYAYRSWWHKGLLLDSDANNDAKTYNASQSLVGDTKVKTSNVVGKTVQTE